MTMEATFIHDGFSIDYTPAAEIAAGEVVVLGKTCFMAKLSIPAGTLGALAATGVYDVLKTDGLEFDPGEAVYWNDTTNLATQTTTDTYMGVAVKTAAAADATVRTHLRSLQEAIADQFGLADLSDVGVSTATAGNLLIADGDSFESVAVSGLLTLAATGAIGLPEAADSQLGLPLVFEKAFDGTAAEVHIFDGDCPRKLRLIDASVLITTAGAAAADVTLTLDDGTDAISDAIAVNAAGAGVAVNTIVNAGEIDNTKAAIDVDGTLDITLSTTTNAPAGIVRITAIPVA
jgi:predicted RecA/RadA family phage recombinase